MIAALVGRFVRKYPLTTRVLLFSAIIGLNGVGFERWYANRRPRVPLEAAIVAIRNRDSTSFFDAVDVDRLVASYYDQHLQQGQPVPEAMRALFIKAIGRRLRHWIDSGSTENAYPHFDALVAFIREATDSRRCQVVDVDEASGSGTIVLQNGAGDTVRLKLKIVREAGRWRVAELLNAAEVVHDVREAEWHRLTPLLRRVNEAVEITPLLVENSVAENNAVTTYLGAVRVKKGRVEAAACDLYSVGGSFVRTIAVLKSPLVAGQSAVFSFQWKDCGAVEDCLPRVRWSQVRMDGKVLEMRPRALD